jgi:hydrogenase-4 component B
MAVLVGCCFLIGLAPILVAPILQKGVSAWTLKADDAGPRLATLAPLDRVTLMSLMLIVAVLAGAALLRMRLRAGVVEHGDTWGCGYTAPTPRMQYTSSSFAQMLVGIFGFVLRPRTHPPKVSGLFPQGTDFHSEVPDLVLDDVVVPTFRSSGRLLSRFRVFQQGNIQVYFLYIFIALIALLLWR